MNITSENGLQYCNKLEYIAERPSVFIRFILFVLLIIANIISTNIISFITVICCLCIAFDPLVKIKLGYCYGVGYFIVMILVGLIGAFNNNIYDVAKDCWYFLNVITVLYLGYLIMLRIKDLESILKIYILASIVLSIYHLSFFIVNPSLLSESAVNIRDQTTTGYYLSVIAIGIMYGSYKYRISLFKRRYLASILTIIPFLSVAFSFSRTLMIALLGVFFAMSFCIHIKKPIKLLAGIVIIFIAIIFLQYGVEPKLNTSRFEPTFQNKILNSINEMKIKDYTDDSDINVNWRGYESYKALKTYLEGSTVEYLIGRGFGTNIKLDIVISLGSKEYSAIPILHNGYLYLLVKTGIVGIFLYLAFLLKLFNIANKMANHINSTHVLAGLLLYTLTILILGTTAVISGVFNKSDLYQILLLVGIILGYYKIETTKGTVSF